MKMDLIEHRKVKEALGIILPRGKKDMSCYEPEVIGEGVTSHKKIGNTDLYLQVTLQFYEKTVEFQANIAVRVVDLAYIDPIMVLGKTSVPYDHFYREHKSTARMFRRITLQYLTDFTANFDALKSALQVGLDE